MAKSKKTPISIRLSDEEMALLKQAAELCDGNQTKALVKGLNALVSGATKKLTKEQLLEEIRRRLR